MIAGLGIDLVAVARIERAMTNPRFLPRILTPHEREIITKPEQVAGRWAAKEAVAKALNLKLRWHDVEILPGPSGEPLATVRGLDSGLSVMVSITHERTHAAAVAVVTRLNS